MRSAKGLLQPDQSGERAVACHIPKSANDAVDGSSTGA